MFDKHVEVPVTFDERLAAAVKIDPNSGEKNFAEWNVRYAPTLVTAAQIVNGVTVRNDDGTFHTFLTITEGDKVSRVVLAGAVSNRIRSAEKRLSKRNRSRISREKAYERMANGQNPFEKKEVANDE